MPTAESCVLAIPAERRALMGLSDLAAPELLLDFKFEQSGERFVIARSSMIGRDLVQAWLGKVPTELRRATSRLVFQVKRGKDTHVKLPLAKPGPKASKEEADQAREVMQIIGDDLLNYRAYLIEALELTATRQDLEARLTALLRLKIKLIMLTTPDALRAPGWLTYPGGVTQAFSAADTLELLRYSQTREGGAIHQECERRVGRRFFRVPFLGRRQADQDLQDMVAFLETQAAQAVLEAVIPRLYAELAPAYQSSQPPSVNDYESVGDEFMIQQVMGEA